MSSDGRNIDPCRGTLGGEGALQLVENVPAHLGQSVYSAIPAPLPGDPTYYGRPVVKKSPWTWTIPAYYYVGGLSGASAALGAAATLLDRGGMTNLIARSRWIGTAGASVSAVLLIYDLGRPERFLYMLRVFRPTSPMSMGTWILVSFSSLIGLAALTLRGPAALRRLGDGAALLSGLLGLALSGYTGVLVANTTVPLWQRPRRLLPVLFLSSATASAASAFGLFPGNAAEQRAVHLFGIAGKVAEIAASAAIESQVAAVPAVVRPLQTGFSGMLWRAGLACSVASLALSLLGSGRSSRRLAAVLGTAGALCVRFGIHYAGQRSAMDPRATFHQQRAGQGSFPVTGSAAITGPGGQRAIDR